MKAYSMVMNQKTQCYYDIIDLQTQCNPSQNPSWVFAEIDDTLNIYIEMQRTFNIKIKKGNKVGEFILPGLKIHSKSYSNQDSVVLF